MLTEKEFLQELSVASNDRKKFVESIASRNLPIMIFGAGVYSAEVTKMLNECNVKVDGYVVDDEYFESNSIYLNRPIFGFSEFLADENRKYILFRGTTNAAAWINTKKRLSNQSNFSTCEFIRDKFYDLTYDEIVAEKEKFFETYSLLSDEISRKTLLLYLNTHISLITNHLESIFEPKEYFNDLTCNHICGGKGIYVDCGAYKGDTIKKFIDFTDGKYYKIYAFEPDGENFAQLQTFVKDTGHENIVLLNCGVWEKKETLKFKSGDSKGSAISENGDTIVDVDSIDNVVGNEPVTLIKMDVEGAELKALKGAVKTMERCRPALAISVYHRKEDLITIPQFLKNIYKNARFYLREHRRTTLLELDLYVVPN